MRSHSLAFLATAAALAVPNELTERAHGEVLVTTPSTGTAGNGYYYSMWKEGSGKTNLTIGNNYCHFKWTEGAVDTIAGIGWEQGAARIIPYEASIEATGNSIIALYGWTTNPLVEYYVIENYGAYNPGEAGRHKGTLRAGHVGYEVYEVTRENAPSINGTQNFKQYLSVRDMKASKGVIMFRDHIKGWKKLGMHLGHFGHQIMATEGFNSSGHSWIKLYPTHERYQEGAGPGP